MVEVKKKDNTNFVCIDYWKLDKFTVFDPETMPTAEHLFQKLSGDKFYSKIDLNKGCCGESTRLPPMWPGFDSRTRRHMWVEFVGSLLCTERFSPGTPVSPLLKNQHLT